MAEPASEHAELLRELERRGIEMVAVTIVDNAGITRAKSIPARMVPRAALAGVGSPRVLGVFTGNDAIAPAGDLSLPVGDLRLVPDVDAIAGAFEGWGFAPADQHDLEGNGWALCPRSFLRRTVALAKARGVELLMAFELEWYAERAEGTPAHTGPAYGLVPLADTGPYLVHVARLLEEHGIDPEQLHAEYSPGQFEVSLPARDPLRAADDCILARHVIRCAAHRSGLRASFSPLTYSGMVGNGCHLHVSAWRDGTNLLAPDGASRPGGAGASFLAGIVDQLPALVGLGCASRLSYERIGPTRWTGAFQCWGIENREAPLRFIPGSRAVRPASANAELKPLDSSGNPYLVAGAVIAAGLRGMEASLSPPAPLAVDPATLSDEERKRRALAPLPGNPEQGAAALEGSAVLHEAFGDDLHRALVAVRQAEAATTQTLSGEELSAFYRWRY
jgi:glutamine synthetase